MTARATAALALAVGTIVSCSLPVRDADSTHLVLATGESRVDRTRWTVSAMGIGTVHIGASLESVAGLLGEPAAGLARGSRPCTAIRTPALPPGVTLIVVGDTVVRVEVDSTGVFTEQGVGVGDTEVGLLVRYSGFIRVETHGIGAHTLFVAKPADSPNLMVFETNGSTVVRYRVGRRGVTQVSDPCGHRPAP